MVSKPDLITDGLSSRLLRGCFSAEKMQPLSTQLCLFFSFFRFIFIYVCEGA